MTGKIDRYGLRTWCLVILSGFLLVGCDSIGPEVAADANSNSGTPPDTVDNPRVLSVIRIAGADVVVLEEGESRRQSIVANDQYGDAWPIDGEPLWRDENPARAGVDGFGLETAGPGNRPLPGLRRT